MSLQILNTSIAWSTDSGVPPHGQNTQEFELMVAGGLTPMQAVQAATIEAAKLVKVEDRLGFTRKRKAGGSGCHPGRPYCQHFTAQGYPFRNERGRDFQPRQKHRETGLNLQAAFGLCLSARRFSLPQHAQTAGV